MYTATVVDIKGFQIYRGIRWKEEGKDKLPNDDTRIEKQIKGGKMREESRKWRDYKLLREEASVLFEF